MKWVELKSVLDLPNGFKIPKPGIPTGLRDLDFDLGGLQPGLVTLLARPGIDATSFMLAIALQAVRSSPVMWVGHHTPSELGLQAACALFDVDRNRIEQGLYPPWRLEGHYRCLGRWLINPFRSCLMPKDLDFRALVAQVESGLLVVDLTVEELEGVEALALELQETARSKDVTVVIRINDDTLPMATEKPWPYPKEMAPLSVMENLEYPANLSNLLAHADLELELLPELDPDTYQPLLGKYCLAVKQPRGCNHMSHLERDLSSGEWHDLAGNALPDSGGIHWSNAD